MATDSGREGELIFRNIYKLLDCDKPFSRLWISSLTDKSITEGLNNLKSGSDYDSLYFAAEARAQADWLIGMNASRALAMINGDNNNSLGRVQTPTLAMVCARYEENRIFKPVPYWVFKAGIEKDGIVVHLTAKEKADNKAQAAELFNRLNKDATIRITKVEQKETAQESPLLYDLTSLQQDANRRHGFSAEQTLAVAQKLYEAKLISYPRTGNRYISEDVFAEIPALITSLQNHPKFSSYVSEMNTKKLNKRSVDDEKIADHHALITTGNLPSQLTADERTVYDMIAGRMLEAFSSRCVKDVLVIQAESGSGMLFETKGSTVREAGWRGVFNMEEEKQEDETSQPLPTLREGEQFEMRCANMLEKQTKPKPLYTEGTLLAAMEHAGRELYNEEQREAIAGSGIGTPATRAAVIETLFKRGYMERDRKNLTPTEKGLQLYHAVKSLQIANAALTGDWESKLVKIEKDPSFREVFAEEIREYTKRVVDEISSLKIIDSSQKLICPKCKTGKLTHYANVTKCSDMSCNLAIFKTMCGKRLTEQQIVELVQKGKTGFIKGFKGKTGKLFDAALKFNDDFKVIFEFATVQKNTKK